MTIPNLADVLVIGGGPAGLSAALALSRQMHKTILFDSGVYRNAISHHMHTLPTWDHKDAADYRASARKELTERYSTTSFVDQKVEKLHKRADGLFDALDADGRSYTGRKVILASGVKDMYPDIEGFAECWGKGIFHCLFCHGYEERGSQMAGVLATGMMSAKPLALGNACIAKRLAASVTLYTNGDTAYAADLGDDAAHHGLEVNAKPIARFSKLPGDASAMKIHFEDGSQEELGFLAHAPKTEPAAPWGEQLGVEVTPTGDFKVEGRLPETSVKGVFAAGDCGQMHKAVPPAVASGTMAAAGAAHQIAMGH